MVLMTFKLRLKKNKKNGNIRLKFNIDKLKDPTIAEEFKANMGGRFAPLLILAKEDIDLETFTDSFNKAITDTASEVLGKHRKKKKPWMTNDLLLLCDKRHELKNKKNQTGGRQQYNEVNKEVNAEIKKSNGKLD